MIAGVVIACLVALCLCGAAVAYLAQNKKGSSAFKSQSRREAPPPPLPETELGTYSTYSDNVVKDADDPHRVDSNPIVDHAADDEGLDDVDIAPGGGNTISKTDTEWCIVRPGGLTNGRPLGNVTPVVGVSGDEY